MFKNVYVVLGVGSEFFMYKMRKYRNETINRGAVMFDSIFILIFHY